MIKVIISYKAKKVVKIEISGHAAYAASGHDIVCAGVSSLVFSTLIYLEKHKLVQMKTLERANHIQAVFDTETEISKHLLQALIEGIQLIQHEYPQRIKIMENGGDTYVKI
ncbi:hypothetical protein AwErysi_09340 [Erysipelotrichaceae bacterium]|nr:hypothetical protein AwErysi_09340 [Erysipelotrichaceae bacterium]